MPSLDDATQNHNFGDPTEESSAQVTPESVDVQIFMFAPTAASFVPSLEDVTSNQRLGDIDVSFARGNGVAAAVGAAVVIAAVVGAAVVAAVVGAAVGTTAQDTALEASPYFAGPHVATLPSLLFAAKAAAAG